MINGIIGAFGGFAVGSGIGYLIHGWWGFFLNGLIMSFTGMLGDALAGGLIGCIQSGVDSMMILIGFVVSLSSVIAMLVYSYIGWKYYDRIEGFECPGDDIEKQAQKIVKDEEKKAKKEADKQKKEEKKNEEKK